MHVFQPVFWRNYRFIGLFGTLVLVLLVYPISLALPFGGALNHAALTLALLNAVYAFANHRRHLLTAGSLAVLATTFTWLQLFLQHPVLEQVSLASNFLLFWYITVRLCVHIWQCSQITVNNIAGGLSGYMLLGMLGAVVYAFIYRLDAEAFQSLSTDAMGFEDFLYYSFVTLNNLGYGEIVPLSPAARIAAILFSMLGLFYMAVLVAVLVGKYLRDGQA